MLSTDSGSGSVSMVYGAEYASMARMSNTEDCDILSATKKEATGYSVLKI